MHLNCKDMIPAPLQSPSGEVIYELIGQTEQGGKVASHSLAHIHLSPEKSSAAHFHKHSDETYYILAGQAHMLLDGKEYLLCPGQTLLIQPGEVHQISNPGPQDLEFLAVCVPAWTAEDSFYR